MSNEDDKSRYLCTSTYECNERGARARRGAREVLLNESGN